MPFLFEVLFIVSLFPIILAVSGAYLRYRQCGRFDNHHPRLQQAQLTGMAARVLAAQKNAWEALILYTSMCVLAYVSPVDITEFNYVAGLFLLSRVAHPVFYLLNMASYRSLVFLVSWLSCLYIGLKAVMGM